MLNEIIEFLGHIPWDIIWNKMTLSSMTIIHSEEPIGRWSTKALHRYIGILIGFLNLSTFSAWFWYHAIFKKLHGWFGLRCFLQISIGSWKILSKWGLSIIIGWISSLNIFIWGLRFWLWKILRIIVTNTFILISFVKETFLSIRMIRGWGIPSFNKVSIISISLYWVVVLFDINTFQHLVKLFTFDSLDN